MSAPDYDNPRSKLKLKLRPARGSRTIIAFGIGIMGASLSALGFLASFWPGVEVAGNPLWFLAAAAVFGVMAAFFYWVRRLLRRFNKASSTAEPDHQR